MRWASALSDPHSSKASLKDLLEDCCRQIKTQLNGEKPDLLIGFVSPHFIDNYEEVPRFVEESLSPAHFIGCSAGGLIGNGQEVEHEPAVALTAAVMPDVNIQPFHFTDLDLPDLDDGPDKWQNLIGVHPERDPAFVLLPDPFSFRIDVLVQGLDFAYPKAVKIGGLASGAHKQGLNALFLGNEVHNDGVVGVALSGNLEVETIVAQGCRPIGKPMRVTRCFKNFLYELDGKPAVNALHDLLETLPQRDKDLTKHSLFIGVVMDEFKDNFQPGDFLIRNILGLEPNTGALVVGEVLRDERTVQFHLRDASTSAEDLKYLLQRYKERHPQQVTGALLFSCLGRGEHLYGVPNHDSECFREYIGQVPLGGFFCNGEIGPVGGTTFLHGYTSSFGIFRTKS